MARFILRRVVRGVVALFLFQSLLFALIHALPYDYTATLLVGPEYRSFIQRQFGLDRPLWEQYIRWTLRFVRFDLGQSYQYWPTSVSEILFSRLFRTLLLFLSAAILAYLLGIWLGKMIAWRRGSTFEFVATLGGVAAYPWRIEEAEKIVEGKKLNAAIAAEAAEAAVDGALPLRDNGYKLEIVKGAVEESLLALA